jgi:hypothetical protein
MFTDPYAKLCLTASVAMSFEKTIYIDLDTTFAAYLQAGMINPPGKIDVLLPTEGRLISMVKDAVSCMARGSVVIFDSVNSFYNLFPIREKTLGSLNHLLSVMLMLLVKRGSEEGVPVLATSMLRYRHSGGWVQSPASRRLLQNKSVVKMKVELLQSGDLSLTVLAHESLPAGKELVLDSGAVTALRPRA